MRGTARAAAALLLTALAATACDAVDPTITVTLDESELQARFDRAFPYDTTRARTRLPTFLSPSLMAPMRRMSMRTEE